MLCDALSRAPSTFESILIRLITLSYTSTSSGTCRSDASFVWLHATPYCAWLYASDSWMARCSSRTLDALWLRREVCFRVQCHHRAASNVSAHLVPYATTAGVMWPIVTRYASLYSEIPITDTASQPIAYAPIDATTRGASKEDIDVLRVSVVLVPFESQVFAHTQGART